MKQVVWDEAREEVKEVNPELYQIIDNLNPSKKLNFLHASYSFGDSIIKDGILEFPSNSQFSLNELTRYGLDYSDIPLSLLLNKHSEIFIHEKNRVIPLKVFSPGMIFGLFETLDYLFGKQKRKLWNVSAGSRSIFTLPKITENTGLRRLRNHYNITADTNILSMADHWHLFKAISNNKDLVHSWKSNVLFFTKDWFAFKKNDPAWFEFQTYLLKNAWLQSMEAMARYEYGIHWQQFIKAITSRKIQPTPYLMDTIRHVLLIASGQAPAFQPATDSESYAPVSALQEAILNVYRLEQYSPIIMHSEMITKKSSKPFYYSMAFPTLLEGSPNSKCSPSTIMLDTKKIKISFETALRDLTISKTILHDKQFKYFHVEHDNENQIISSKEITKYDERFQVEKQAHLQFCASSPFWRGCIMIQNAD